MNYVSVLALHDFKTKCSVEDQASGDSTKSTEINPDSSEGSHALKPPSPLSQMPVTAQMVVFCSWRIVKEACFILADIVTKYKPNSNCAINTTQIVEITDYITKIVVESRHLGAFEKSFLALQQIVKFLWTQTAILETKIPSGKNRYDMGVTFGTAEVLVIGYFSKAEEQAEFLIRV